MNNLWLKVKELASRLLNAVKSAGQEVVNFFVEPVVVDDSTVRNDRWMGAALLLLFVAAWFVPVCAKVLVVVMMAMTTTFAIAKLCDL